MSLGVVQWERARTRRGRDDIEPAQQDLGSELLAVLVAAEVRVRVEHGGSGRQQPLDLAGDVDHARRLSLR